MVVMARQAALVRQVVPGGQAVPELREVPAVWQGELTRAKHSPQASSDFQRRRLENRLEGAQDHRWTDRSSRSSKTPLFLE